MKNVVVTGLGIVSCIGSNVQQTLESLKKGRSGISKNSTYEEMGFRSHVSGSININLSELIDRKILRFMSEASGFGYLAAQEALHNASINLEEMTTERVGIVAGSGGASSAGEGTQKNWPLCCYQNDGEHCFCYSGDYSQASRGKLLHIISLFNERALHWSCCRTHSTREARYYYCRWCRARTLDLIINV